VLGLPLEFQPGSSYHYSNPGYSIAGYIVQKVRSQGGNSVRLGCLAENTVLHSTQHSTA